MNITGIIASSNPYRHSPILTDTTGLTLTNIPFTTVSGSFTESPAGKWGTGPGLGLSNISLAASTAGFIQMEYQGVGYRDAGLSFDLGNALEAYTGHDWGMAVDSGGGNYLYVVAGVANDSGLLAVAGDLMRINVTAIGKITFEYSRNGGRIWQLVFTFPALNTAQKFVKADIIAATNYILNPKGYGLT